MQTSTNINPELEQAQKDILLILNKSLYENGTITEHIYEKANELILKK